MKKIKMKMKNKWRKGDERKGEKMLGVMLSCCAVCRVEPMQASLAVRGSPSGDRQRQGTPIKK